MLYRCCFCGVLVENGHDASPIKPGKKCCNVCNVKIVSTAKRNLALKKRKY